MSLTPAQAVTLAFLLGMLTVLVLLYAADAIQRRHRRKRRLPTPQPRQQQGGTQRSAVLVVSYE
jgi:hypothetical protein